MPRSIEKAGAAVRSALRLPDDAPLLLPMASIAAVLALLAAAYALAAGWLTPRRLTPEKSCRR
jgi:hypothetical protein